MFLEKLQEDRINDFLTEMKDARITEQDKRKWLPEDADFWDEAWLYENFEVDE